MEVLVLSFTMPLSEVKALSVRERRNWVIRAVDRMAARKRALNG